MMRTDAELEAIADLIARGGAKPGDVRPLTEKVLRKALCDLTEEEQRRVMEIQMRKALETADRVARLGARGAIDVEQALEYFNSPTKGKRKRK
jgi:hypothetical protein